MEKGADTWLWIEEKKQIGGGEGQLDNSTALMGVKVTE